MTREDIRKLIIESRITAVIRLDDLSTFQPLAETLLEAGIRSMEFTLTNRDALKAVKGLRQQMDIFDKGQAVIGVGSVRNADDAQAAIDSGAQLLVSPVIVPGMIQLALDHNVVSAPGAYTPTEIETAWQAGADVVKVFPANTLGPGYMKAVRAPMPDLRLMPTGGIDLDNIQDYLRAGCVAVGVGSSLLNPKMIEAGDWDALRDHAASYVKAVEAI